MKKLRTEFKARWNAETPIWFKRMRKVSLKLSGIAMALLAANLSIPGFALPELITKICTYIVVGGITAGLVSTTAKVD